MMFQINILLLLTLCQSRTCSSSNGNTLEYLNQKCKTNDRQSYFNNYCFQYNTLSNIHHILSLGEELLQIGPIDLINLKNDFFHTMQDKEINTQIIYPENSPKQRRISLSNQIESRALLSNSGRTWGGHNETKREIREETNGNLDQGSKEYNENITNTSNRSKNKIDYYYSSNEDAVEDMEDYSEEEIDNWNNMEHDKNSDKSNNNKFGDKLYARIDHVHVGGIGKNDENNETAVSDVKIGNPNTNEKDKNNTDFDETHALESDDFDDTDKNSDGEDLGQDETSDGVEHRADEMAGDLDNEFIIGAPESRALLKPNGENRLELYKIKEDKYFINDELNNGGSIADLQSQNLATPPRIKLLSPLHHRTRKPAMETMARTSDKDLTAEASNVYEQTNFIEPTETIQRQYEDLQRKSMIVHQPNNPIIKKTNETIHQQNNSSLNQLNQPNSNAIEPNDAVGTNRGATRQPNTESGQASMDAANASWITYLDEIAKQLNEIFSTYGITIPIPDWSDNLPTIIPLDELNPSKRNDDEDAAQSMSRRRTNKHPKKYMALFPLLAVLKFMAIKALLIPLLIAVLIIKKIIILGVIALPYVFSLLRVCRNGPGLGLLFGGGGGIGGGGGLGGNQVAANAPYLSAVDTAVDYAGYGTHASYKDFGGGARWMDRYYPNIPNQKLTADPLIEK